MMPAFDPRALDALIAEHRDRPGALLPLLHAVQDTLGYVPPEAVEPIARALARSRAEVHGVITYYHHLRTTPPPAHTVHICRAEACQACGAEALLAHARTAFAGKAAVEPIYCLGLCASGPAIEIDGQLHACATPETLTTLACSLDPSRACPPEAAP